jgi:hypothetical protein
LYSRITFRTLLRPREVDFLLLLLFRVGIDVPF